VYDAGIQRNQETHMAENGKAVVLVSAGWIRFARCTKRRRAAAWRWG